MFIRWQSSDFVDAGVTPEQCLGPLVSGSADAPGRLRSLVELRLRALDAALAVDQPMILADQFSWEQVRLRSIAPETAWSELDSECRQTLSQCLPAGARARVETISEKARGLLGEDGRAPWEPAPSKDSRVLDFLERVLAGDRSAALKVVTTAAAETDDVTSVMLDLIQPAQRELGRAWQEGRATVAQEHFGTAVAQQALALLYPRLFGSEPHRHRVVAVAGGDELHEIGLRIVTDVLEHHGWDTTYLGSMVPFEDVVDQVATSDADILALSVSMPGHLGPTRELVRMLRADARCDAVRVLVGGRLITLVPALAPWLGADACASDAREVPQICEGLLAARDRPHHDG